MKKSWLLLPKRLRQVIAFTVGSTLVLCGLALVVLPGPFTMPLVIGGLIVLALEFAWAETLLIKAKHHASKIVPKKYKKKQFRHNCPVPHAITCVELLADDWERVRDIRLQSLLDSPHAFGGTYDNEIAFDEARWRLEFAKQAFIISSVNGEDAGIMYVENLAGDFGATCWIGGCWTNPKFRGVGLMRSMFDYLDHEASSRDWLVQGLGVWTDNDSAITAYEKLGFIEMGGPQPSSRQPGKFYQRMIRKTASV